MTASVKLDLTLDEMDAFRKLLLLVAAIQKSDASEANDQIIQEAKDIAFQLHIF